MQVIRPFEFLTEQEAAKRLSEIEEARNPKQYPVVVIDKSERKNPGNIKNDSNPFLNFCKKVFDFAKDNVRIRISAMPFNKDIMVGDFVPGPMDKIKVPPMSTTIGVGPLEVNLNSEEKEIPLGNFKTKRNKGIYT